MPNFWSSTTQKIYEVMYGPRTRDTEFDQKVKEFNLGIESIRTTNVMVNSFPSRTAGIQKLCQDVYTTLENSYSSNSAYSQFMKEVIEAHKGIESAYLKCINTFKSINLSTSEWDKLITEVTLNLKQRDEARWVYDHYDSKFEKLVHERNDKFSRRQEESPKEIEKFARNDAKYKRAANDWIQLSNFTYKQIQDCLDSKYKVLNSGIAVFVNEEKKFFEACASFFSKFDNLTSKISGWDWGFQKTPIHYDPTRHVRAARLLVGINTNDLPQVKSKEKYSYNDYLNSKEMTGNDSNTHYDRNEMNPFANSHYYNYQNNLNNEANSNAAMNDHKHNNSEVVKPFTYEAFKQQLAKTSKTKLKQSGYVPSNTTRDKMPEDPFSKPDNHTYVDLSIPKDYLSPTLSDNNHFRIINNSETNNIHSLPMEDINPYARIRLDTPLNNINGNLNDRNNNYNNSTMIIPTGDTFSLFNWNPNDFGNERNHMYNNNNISGSKHFDNDAFPW